MSRENEWGRTEGGRTPDTDRVPGIVQTLPELGCSRGGYAGAAARVGSIPMADSWPLATSSISWTPHVPRSAEEEIEGIPERDRACAPATA